jgi:hypothetical protein
MRTPDVVWRFRVTCSVERLDARPNRICKRGRDAAGGQRDRLLAAAKLEIRLLVVLFYDAGEYSTA